MKGEILDQACVIVLYGASDGVDFTQGEWVQRVAGGEEAEEEEEEGQERVKLLKPWLFSEEW